MNEFVCQGCWNVLVNIGNHPKDGLCLVCKGAPLDKDPPDHDEDNDWYEVIQDIYRERRQAKWKGEYYE